MFNITSLTKLLSILCFVFMLPACQLTQPLPQKTLVSDYYLWIKNLSKQELSEEIAQQQQNLSAGLSDANIHLILLYALPESPVYNPYTAKTLLNNFSITEQAQYLSSHDFGLLSLLRDLLNQQIITANKLLLVKQSKQENDSAQQTLIEEKQAAIDKLEQQIAQLKRIELTIENKQ